MPEPLDRQRVEGRLAEPDSLDALARQLADVEGQLEAISDLRLSDEEIASRVMALHWERVGLKRRIAGLPDPKARGKRLDLS